MSAETAGEDGHQEAHEAEASVAELRARQEEIQLKLKEAESKEKAAVLDQIFEVAGTYNISLEEIVERFGGLKPKRKGVAAKPKYQDPVSGATWSGRGKEPIWIRGKNRDEFTILAEVTTA